MESLEDNSVGERVVDCLDKDGILQEENREIELPNGMIRLESQVAGHLFDSKKNTPGMLRSSNGCVFKPGEKQILQEREIAFYETIQKSYDPIYRELLNFTPKYHGTTELCVMGKKVKFLILQDITEGMLEPCVMDIKIGKRTWDPLASPDKKSKEDNKYRESKEAYGFCIPGFQVYNLSDGVLKKYKKDYGKQLNAKTVIEALEIFLNVTEHRPPCRDIIIKLLSSLWKILAFFRSQTKLRFYSSSLLIAYDATRLRQLIRLGMTNDCSAKSCAINTRGKTFSVSPSANDYVNESRVNNDLAALTTSPVSLQINKTNRRKALQNLNIFKRSSSFPKMNLDFPSSPPTSPLTEQKLSLSPNGNSLRNLEESIGKLCRTHSQVHNYERDMMEIKQDYAFLLQELTGQSKNYHDWVRVFMIDFTHVFPAEEESVDKNYLDGIENIIKILESFLS